MVIKLDPPVDNSAELFRRKQAADKLASEQEDEGLGNVIGGLLGAAGGYLVGNVAGIAPGYAVGSQVGKGAVVASEGKTPDVDTKNLLLAATQLSGAASGKEAMDKVLEEAARKKLAADAAIKSLNLGGPIL